MKSFTMTEVEVGEHADWLDTIRQGLYQHNREQVGTRHLVELALVAQDADGDVIGGILGESIWGWMLVSTLWVAPGQRKNGLGSALLAEAEKIARLRGCGHITLETFTFQALAFYQKRGYEIYGRLDDFPPGHTRFSLRKQL